ncbi:D-ribulokinase [Paraphoma chrysanthemicola]|nr:D-ribulokinase [Paraphoma chrysanthemicola]
MPTASCSHRVGGEDSDQQNYYIGIDVGTGSARACVVNQSGDIVGLASKDIGLWQPKAGYYEQSTTDIWHSICHAVKHAIAESAVDVSLIKGLGFDATCSLAVFDSKTNEPISVSPHTLAQESCARNVILWLDHRAEEETKEINSTGHNTLRYVGGTMSVEMEIPKILWLKKNMPKDLFDRCSFYDLTDALEHLATGNEKRSNCSAVCKQGYIPIGVDGSTTGWQEDFLKEIGLSSIAEEGYKRLGGVHDKNGDYLSAGELAGHLCERAADDLGLPKGLPIGSGVIDAYAGWIGTVGAKVDGLYKDDHEAAGASNGIQQTFSRLAVVSGTSTCHLLMSSKPVFVDGVWGPYRDVITRGAWMAEGGQSATGKLLQHVLETHPAYNQAMMEAKVADMNIFDFLNHHLRNMQASTAAPSIPYIGRHLFFYGDLYGNRSPVADSTMSGSIVGLTADISINNLAIHYYGTMEFIALQTKQIIIKMNESGHSISSIFMSGSQCQNELLMSLVATACNMAVVIPHYVTAAVCHGAAMLGAKAATASVYGKTDDLWSIIERMSKPGRVVWPMKGQGVDALLDVKYRVFLEQCERQRYFRQMVDIVVQYEI